MNLNEGPPGGRPRVRDACAPYSDPGVVSHFAIIDRLSPETVRWMAGMLAIVAPRHFETAVMRDGDRQ